jgi:hypothetical protein
MMGIGMPNSQNKTPLPKPIASTSVVPISRFNSVGVKKFPRIVRRPAFSSAAVSLATRSPINARQECAAASSQFAPLGEEVARPLGAPADRRVMGNLIALAYRCHGRAHRMCAAHSVVGPAYKGARWLTAKLIIFNRHSSDHARSRPERGRN